MNDSSDAVGRSAQNTIPLMLTISMLTPALKTTAFIGRRCINSARKYPAVPLIAASSGCSSSTPINNGTVNREASACGESLKGYRAARNTRLATRSITRAGETSHRTGQSVVETAATSTAATRTAPMYTRVIIDLPILGLPQLGP